MTGYAERTTHGGHAIGYVLQAASLGQIRRLETFAVVDDAENDLAVGALHGQRCFGRLGMFATVPECLDRDVIQGDLEILVPATGSHIRSYLQAHEERQSADVRADRGSDTSIGEHARVDSPCEVLQVEHRLFGLSGQLSQVTRCNRRSAR